MATSASQMFLNKKEFLDMENEQRSTLDVKICRFFTFILGWKVFIWEVG
jgi:hypothetical protein